MIDDCTFRIAVDPLCDEDSGNSIAQGYANDSLMNSNFVKYCMAFAASTRFGDISDKLTELVTAFAQSWMQSRINELANKKLRDAELRKTHSQVDQRSGALQTCANANTAGEMVELRACFFPSLEGCQDGQAMDRAYGFDSDRRFWQVITTDAFSWQRASTWKRRPAQCSRLQDKSACAFALLG